MSSSDGVFKNIIAPVAEHAAQVALNRSPVAGCKPGMGGMFLSFCARCIATILFALPQDALPNVVLPHFALPQLASSCFDRRVRRRPAKVKLAVRLLILCPA